MGAGPTRAPVCKEMTITVWHDPVDVLTELHDSYVWDVNAAVAEGREDLVRDLADDYFERSVRLMMGEQPTGCGRPDCVMCATRSPAPRQRWWHRLHR
jgi:hypothetical protein